MTTSNGGAPRWASRAAMRRGRRAARLCVGTTTETASPLLTARSMPLIRVLAITSLYPPHAVGGYELACHDVMSRWARQGHDVCVLATRTRLPDAGDDEASAVLVDRCLSLVQYPPPGVAVDHHPATVLTLADLARLETRLRRHRPNVVSLWQAGGLSG